MRRTTHVLVLALAAACTNKLTGEVAVDGKPLAIKFCRSGAAGGFFGVDFVDVNGSKLRLVALPTGQASALLFPGGAATAIELGACGVISIAQQNSSVNDIRNVMGKVTLACERAGHAVNGTLTFENCH